ncbi:MAG TPA: LUD domain-containing protein [Puia sp.]|nr:LUD domain-containing protein [Puia sp.]
MSNPSFDSPSFGNPGSRDKILNTVHGNQPAPRELPPLPEGTPIAAGDLAPTFITALEAIGAAAYIVSGFDRITTMLHEQFPGARRVVTGCPQLSAFAEAATGDSDPHTLENVDLAILPAHFGVAENGACWITEMQMVERVLPFIAQHLVLVISSGSIVPNMHAAYDRIATLEATPASTPYGFSTFIAGPSKTADIEQSLVLGAHGPISLIVFLLDEQLSDAGYY